MGPRQKLLFFAAGCVLVVGAVLSYLYYQNHLSTEPVPSWGKHVENVGELKQIMEGAAKKIVKAMGDGKCGSDSDCKVAGMGAKLCGSHEKYLIYSAGAEGYDEEEMKRLLAEYNGAAERLNKISFKVLSCGVAAPKVRCSQKYCVPVQ